jgi:hypothetical protein
MITHNQRYNTNQLQSLKYRQQSDLRLNTEKNRTVNNRHEPKTFTIVKAAVFTTCHILLARIKCK